MGLQLKTFLLVYKKYPYTEVLAETTPISGALPHNVLQLTPLYNIWRRQRGFMCFCKRLYCVIIADTNIALSLYLTGE
jgi:hypothetical protein